MNVIFYGASVTAQKEQAGYFFALESLFDDQDKIQFHRVCFAASVFDQAGYGFMRSIERLTSEPTVCFIDWLTPGAQKFKLEKIEALSEYLLSLNCLPIWVNFPRSDDLGNERECYSQVSSHCERWNLPFVDVYKDSRVSSLDIEELLRDKVHTTPLGGKVYAQVLFDFIRALDVKFQLERINRDDHKSSLVAPTLIDKKFTLKTGMRIDVGFNSPNDTNFELYFLSEIGPYTPVLELSFLNVKTKETQSHIVNCLDKWSHYNRKKCIKVLWMKIVAGEYRLSVRAVNTPAIEEIDIKKPVDQERYPEGEPLHLPVEQLSCNVKVTSFTTSEE